MNKIIVHSNDHKDLLLKRIIDGKYTPTFTPQSHEMYWEFYKRFGKLVEEST